MMVMMMIMMMMKLMMKMFTTTMMINKERNKKERFPHTSLQFSVIFPITSPNSQTIITFSLNGLKESSVLHHYRIYPNFRYCFGHEFKPCFLLIGEDKYTSS